MRQVYARKERSPKISNYITHQKELPKKIVVYIDPSKKYCRVYLYLQKILLYICLLYTSPSPRD